MKGELFKSNGKKITKVIFDDVDPDGDIIEFENTVKIEITKWLKKKLECNGCFKEGDIYLSGDQREKLTYVKLSVMD